MRIGLLIVSVALTASCGLPQPDQAHASTPSGQEPDFYRARHRMVENQIEARGIADAQKIIRTTLDPMFLQFEALRAIEDLAGSTNTTFIVMPFSEKGGAPIIMSMD